MSLSDKPKSPNPLSPESLAEARALILAAGFEVHEPAILGNVDLGSKGYPHKEAEALGDKMGDASESLQMESPMSTPTPPSPFDRLEPVWRADSETQIDETLMFYISRPVSTVRRAKGLRGSSLLPATLDLPQIDDITLCTFRALRRDSTFNEFADEELLVMIGERKALQVLCDCGECKGCERAKKDFAREGIRDMLGERSGRGRRGRRP